MSYHWEPIFVCAICKRAKSAYMWEDVPFGTRVLPEGWSGSERKHGDCYCERCTRGIKKIGDEVNDR